MNDDPIELLGAGYFHQDWFEDVSTDREVVEQFAIENPELVRPALDRIAKLKEWSERDLAKYFDKCRFNYDPRLTGTSYVEWLESFETWLEAFSD